MLVRVLGPVDVIDDSGAAHAPGSPLRRTLLALMAVHAGEVLTADWLLEHAWSGEPPESGARALRFHISRLRAELGQSDLIETRSGGYRLAVSPEHVDACAVEQLARSTKLELDHERANEIYDEMMSMWRGEPFVDVAPCADLDNESGRLAELRLAIAEDYFRSRLDAGQGRELVAELTQQTARHPLRESLWSTLITAQYRAGLQADALRSYEQHRVMLAESLGLDPSSELQDLQRRVLQQDPELLGIESEVSAAVVPSPRHNLPSLATARIDSDDRVGTAQKLLEDHRLLTLTGAGGVGKTRLAIELGRACVDQFEDGVWLVELAPVARADLVVAALASTLSVPPAHTSLDALVDWFHGGRLLLIIDNCEHVIDPVRELLGELLRRCPSVKVVATSRESLGVVGERVHAVDILRPEVDGVALFLERASAADSSFEISDDQHDAVVGICTKLDGLPLAIELAAARVRAIAPVDLLARLDDRFTLLRGHGAVDHHRTLQATVEWSYRLLSDHEQTVLNRLSVFAGGCDLSSAEIVCAEPGRAAFDVTDVLMNLVDKSMIIAERRDDGTRYRMLETIREFARRQLQSDGDASEIRERHLMHFADLAADADNMYRSARQKAGAGIFGREWDNLREALDWAVATENLEVAEQLISASRLYAVGEMRYEHGDWIERTLALGTAERTPSSAMFGQGACWAWSAERTSRARELLDRGLELAGNLDSEGDAICWMLARPLGHPRTGESLGMLAKISAKVDLDRNWWILVDSIDRAWVLDPSSVPARVADLVERAGRLRAPALMVDASIAQGNQAIDRRPCDLETAFEFYAAALDIAADSREPIAEANCRRHVAMAAVGLRRDDALETWRQALASLYDIRFWHRIWQLFESIAWTLARDGRIEPAAVVMGHLEAHHPPYGFETELGYRTGALDIVTGHVDGKALMARGAAMDRHQIVEYALAEMAQ